MKLLSRLPSEVSLTEQVVRNYETWQEKLSAMTDNCDKWLWRVAGWVFMVVKGNWCKKQPKFAEIPSWGTDVSAQHCCVSALSWSDEHLPNSFLFVLVYLNHFGVAEDSNNPVLVLSEKEWGREDSGSAHPAKYHQNERGCY